MDQLKIRGGHKLSGTIEIEGAKNAALLLMTASLLTEDSLLLSNIPPLADIHSMIHLIKHLGGSTHFDQTARTLKIQTHTLGTYDAPYDIVRKMRASVLVLGPLLARQKRARVSLPGGCAIGVRPIDFHIEGLKALGAHIDICEGYIEAYAPKGLQGGVYVFPQKTVTGTANLMLAATLAKGETRLKNVAMEPEIVDLGRCLQKMGAVIEGLGRSTLCIQGVDSLKGATHKTLPDRIETGTYIIAAAITGGRLFLKNTTMDLLPSFSESLKRMGVAFKESQQGIDVKSPEPHLMEGFDIQTAPYPAFATDLQAQTTALLTQTKGVSSVTENLFENRFMHVSELLRMGANIKIKHNTALITGSTCLKSAPLMATDLRASACLVLAALAAKGESTIQRIYHLDRGYHALHKKLAHVGADIERISVNDQKQTANDDKSLKKSMAFQKKTMIPLS